MKMLRAVVFVGLALVSAGAVADEISGGAWLQTSSSVGDCATCEISITRVTPHVLYIQSNTEWIGHAYYDRSSDTYKGVLEWKSGQGGEWGNQLFFFDLVYQGGTLTLTAKSSRLSFSATFRPKP